MKKSYYGAHPLGLLPPRAFAPPVFCPLGLLPPGLLPPMTLKIYVLNHCMLYS